MADLALAGGIGQGLMSFANSYSQAKQQQTTNALNQQQADRAEGNYKAGLLSKGMQQNADGTVGYTPQKQAQVDTANKLATQQQQEQSAMLDENSDESKATYQNIKARYDALPLGDSSTIPQGKSGQWYKDFYETPHLADAEKMNNAIQIANVNAKGKLDVANANNAGKTGKVELNDLKGDQKTLMNDPDYKTASNSVQESNRALALLDSAQQGNPIAGNALPILTAKVTSGLKRINTQEIQAMGGDKALDARFQQAMEQASTGKLTPENLQFMKQMIQSTQGADQQNLENVKQQHATLRASNKGIDVPTAYQQLTGTPMQQKGGGLIGGQPQSTPAPNGHASVKQNGVTFNWNAQTGKYEASGQ